ncbi:MAG: hypothetical protein WA435_00520 [Gallionellaceae bacterium]
MRAIAILFFLLSFISTQAFALDQFQTEKQAQQHCPKDTVVWLNLPTGVFHFKGQRWYGRTKNGAYVCKKEAIKEGDRATRNGQ